ncbi:MAG: M14 family zinc carboxypeptidase [Phycisphaerales bacterium]
MRYTFHLAALAGAAACVLTSPAQGQVSTRRDSIGSSASGQPITVLTLGEARVDRLGRTMDERPAILIVAGLQGHHRVGVDVAQGVAERIAAEHADLLTTRTVYIIPNANPDGAAWLTGVGGLRVESGRVPASRDADGDGRVDEDGPDDLNGDGLITQMRVRLPDARWGLTANLVPDPDEPRLMRAAKPIEGESGQWAVLTEGIDNDGDGRFNEDGGGALTGGIDLGMNFPTHYPEHQDGAGRYPLESAEALALVRWMQAHSNIQAVIVYDPHDNLVTVPAAGQFGPEGRVPRGVEEGDRAYYQHISDAFKEITRMTGAPTGSTAGSFASWAYADFGVPTFSTPVWVRPDQVRAEGEEAEDAGGQDDGGAEADREGERQALIAEGFPAHLADFLLATVEQRRVMMEEMAARPAAEHERMMAEVMALPPALRERVMRAAQEVPDVPFLGQEQDLHDHDHDHRGGTRAPVSMGADGGVGLETIRQPAGRRPGGRAGGSGSGGGAGRGPAGGAGETDDHKWLAFSDQHRNGEGFVEWTEVEHPQFGTVEVGGFVPGFRFNPSPEVTERLADEQAAFVAALLPMLPDAVLDPVDQEQIAPGLWRVRASVHNPGFLPTHSAIALKARRVIPIVVQISVEPERVLDGARVERFDSIEGSNAVRRAEWLIRGERGDEVTVEMRSDSFGVQRETIRLGTINLGGPGGSGQGGGR